MSLSDGERITSVIPVSEFAGDQYLLMLTVNGFIKKVPLNVFSAIRTTGIIAIQLVCYLFSNALVDYLYFFIYNLTLLPGSW